MAGRMINGAALAELIRPASGTDEPGVHRVLPVLPGNVRSALYYSRGFTVSPGVHRAGSRPVPGRGYME